MFLGPFLSSFRGVSGRVFVLTRLLPSGSADAIRGDTWSAAVFGVVVQMNARTKPLPALHNILLKRSMFTSPVTC